MTTDDYLADYALLQLQPGCSLETLERAWRKAVSELHPDRDRNGSEAARRLPTLQDITVAYKRLRLFEREHGRLPGEIREPPPTELNPPVPVEPFAAFAEAETKMHSAALSASAWRTPWLLAPMVAAMALWMAIGLDGPAEVPSQPESVEATAAYSAGAAVSQPAPTALQAPARIRIGSTEILVESLIGAPLVTTADLWEYGPSHVRFHRGRVVGWYSSPLKPLPVEFESR
jgi:hypothetical protein